MSELEYKYIKNKLLYEGRERLSYRIKIPRFFSAQAVNAFFDSIAELCESFCRESLFLALCQKSFDENAVRRGRAAYAYRLDCNVTHFDGSVVSVLIDVSLAIGGERIFFSREAISLRCDDGKMLLPQSLISLFGADKGEFSRNERKRLYVSDGAVRACK